MDLREIEITLNKEEENLIDEINELQKNMDDINPEKMHNNLMSTIGNKAIETITTALGVSDILESRAHHSGLEYNKEYKRYEEWKNKPGNNEDSKYKAKFVPSNEFKEIIDKSKSITYNRKELEGSDFRKAKAKMHADNPEGFTCEFSNRHLKHGEKSDLGAKYEYEHVMSLNEIANDVIMTEFMSLKERREFAHSKDNLVVIDGAINGSKSKTKIKNIPKWLSKQSKEDPTKTNEEYYKIDREKLNECVEKSQKKRAEVLKEKSKTYDLTTTTKIAASNALKSGAKAAVGQLLSITVVEVINEYKKKESTSLSQKVKNIGDQIKLRAKDIIKTFKDFSISSFISTILDLILKSLFKIAKNIFKFVKAAFSSILKAIKVLFDTSLSWKIRLQEALKILGAAVVTMIGIALDELIEKALIATFPFMAGSAGFVSPIISGLIVGIASVLLLQGFQKHQNNIEFRKLQTQDSNNHLKLSKINLAQAAVSDVKATETVKFTMQIFSGTLHFAESCKNEIDESYRKISEHKDKIKTQIEDLVQGRSETDDLLAQLNSI
jgi:CRISPR/Cas system-associated protein endoribonuclease Cas2